MWSALKYALRYCQILENQELIGGEKQESEWAQFFASPASKQPMVANGNETQHQYGFKPRIKAGWRTGGNIRI